MDSLLTPPNTNDSKAVSLLSQSISNISGIGKKSLEALARHKIHSIYDFLYSFPYRYDILQISTTYGEKGLLSGKLETYGIVRTRNGKRMLKAMFSYPKGYIIGVWLNPRGEYPASTLTVGEMYYLYGTITRQDGSLAIFHPEFLKESDIGKIRSVYVTPMVIPLTTYRKFVATAIDKYLNNFDETLPEYILDKYNYPAIIDAINTIHLPQTIENVNTIMNREHPAYKRFIYEEFLYVRLAVEMKRKYYNSGNAISFNIDKEFMNNIKDAMPFKLTNSQRKVIVEVFNDMINVKQMNRLIQGDVGSGKTVLAFIAAAVAVSNGYQALLIAPTEVLAEQHFANITSKFKYSEIKPCLLTGSVTKKNKQEIKSLIATNSVNFVIGTHAIIEDDVEFHKLGLVVVDEQHRFGVRQRKTLIDKGYTPDILLMTATPIPRTLAMTLYGDLDVSIIDELPPGRIPMVTKSYSSKQLDNALQFVGGLLDDGGRAYFVYPLIDESDTLDLKNATKSYEYITNYYKNKRVGLLHGKMKPDEKRSVLQAFKSGDIEVLVSTTVIEVGVDVPEATVIVIENAERFGLSQLHQLRGRVGRNDIQSYCVLVTGENISDTGKKRIKAMVDYRDGFKLAEIDLELRGQGDFFGTKQSGVPDFKFANIISDVNILKQATKDAMQIIQDDPELQSIDNKNIKRTFELLYSGGRSYLGIG